MSSDATIITSCVLLFFFNDTATTEIYTLSLHDALPISRSISSSATGCRNGRPTSTRRARSEEHTSELQSLAYLVCRLLLEKKKHYTEERTPRYCWSDHRNSHRYSRLG